MSEQPTEAYIVRASWEDQRLPGQRISRLYAALTRTPEEAEAAVRSVRDSSDKVEVTGDRFSQKTTEVFRLRPGAAVEL